MKIKNVRLNIVPTKSSTYFLPILDSLINFKFIHLLQNSYVMNDEKEGCFSVLYKWNGKPEFTEWEKNLMENHLFVGHEDYDEYVLYKFKLPKNSQDILKLFVEGKYSKYPDHSKEAIKSFLEKRGFLNADKIFRIMNLDENLRLQMQRDSGSIIQKGQELSAPPDMNSENFLNSVKFLSSKGGVEFF
jgi:hypothetical protein